MTVGAAMGSESGPGVSFRGKDLRPRRFEGTQAKTYCVGWDKLGNRVATGGSDATACVWRVSEDEHWRTAHDSKRSVGMRIKTIK